MYSRAPVLPLQDQPYRSDEGVDDKGISYKLIGHFLERFILEIYLMEWRVIK